MCDGKTWDTPWIYQGGSCGWCGSNGMCCKKGQWTMECDGTVGGENHVCVEKKDMKYRGKRTICGRIC